MHLRKLTLTVGLVGALCSTWAYGLGLGEITLNSTLNQPLDAEIKLLQVRDLTEEDILVGLAAAEDFQRFGVERIFFLQGLQFDVQLDAPDGPIVHITTSQPVREPYLIFLLEAESSGGGRLLREYTLLMDLPVFADEAAQAVQGVQTRPEPEPAQAPRQQAQQPAHAEPAPVQRQGEPPRAQPAPQQAASAQPGVEVYGPVQANDTLWEIAQRVRPNSQVSIQQSMLALQRANPEAFINGNINLLKRGQVLRIPDANEFQSLDQRAAVNQVAQQNQQWSSARDAQVAGAELDASPSRPSARSEQQGPRGQLTLAAPGGADGAGDRSGAGDTAARTEALQNELAITAEELDASERENRELNTRVAELEEQISTMQRLIEVSNEELRAMQLAAEQRQATDSEDQSGAVADETDVAVADVAAAETEATSAAGAEPVAQPDTKTVIRQPAQQQSLLGWLMDKLWYLLIAFLAILGGVVYFLHRRNQAAEAAEMEAFEADNEDIFADIGDPGVDAEPEEYPSFDEHLDFGDEDQAVSDEETEQPELPVEAETGDAVGEADIYIAYGKFDQAEEMLQKAILDEPNNIEARLKLLEVYSETKDITKFDGEYGQLMSIADPEAISRAASLRSSIPDAGQYEAADGDEVSSSEQGEQLSDEQPRAYDGNVDSIELSLDTEEELDTATATNAEEGGENELDDLMLDLDDELVDFTLGVESEKESDEELDTGEDSSFDFDLDFGDEEKRDGGDDDGAQAGELDLSAEFAADTATDKAELGSLEFDLDLDGSSDDEISFDLDDEESPILTKASDLEDEMDLELDPDLGDKNDSPDAGADIFSDLEFTTAASNSDNDEMPRETGHVEPEATDLGLGGSNDDEDDFSMDMGDIDLEALDREMDELVGETDDLGDDNVAVASPTGTVAALNEKTAAAAVEEFDLDDFPVGDFGADESENSEGAGVVKTPATESADTFAFGADQEFDEEESGLDGDLDSELDFLADADEVATKLDLARAYIDMGDQEGARDILDEVSGEGNDDQKREAAELLEKMGT